jgi:hypothetical protein
VTVDKVSQAGTGKFTLGNGRTLTAEVEAVAGTFTSGGTVEVTATAGNTAYIVGNVTGVSSTAVNVCGVNVTGLGTLELTGNVTGSAGNASSAANGHAAVYTKELATPGTGWSLWDNLRPLLSLETSHLLATVPLYASRRLTALSV